MSAALALPTPKDIQRTLNTAALRQRALAVVETTMILRERCETPDEAEKLRRELHALIGCFTAKRVDVPELEAEERRIEARIGVLLGPPVRTGRPPEDVKSSPDDDFTLHNQNRHDFRLMARFPEIVERCLAAGEVARKQIVRRLRDAAEHAARDQADSQLPDHAFFACSCAELVEHVAGGSVDVVICDPPYAREYLSVYSELSRFAAHALKDGGLCVALAGQSYLPDVLSALAEKLTYHWLGCYRMPGGQASGNRPRGVNAFWKPICIFAKGTYEGSFGDVVTSDVNDNDAGLIHPWGQSESGMRNLIQRFSRPGDLVCDPFLGSGTIAALALREGRSCIGGDQDARWIEETRRRVGDV